MIMATTAGMRNVRTSGTLSRHHEGAATPRDGVSSNRRMDTFLQDVRYGVRTLVRQPGFAATAVLTLALGIGATTAIFSVVNAVVLRPLPFAAPDRIVAVTNNYTRLGTSGATVSGPDFMDWREQSRSFAVLAHYRAFETSVRVGNASDYAMVVRVGPGYFDVFGATAQVGRLLSAEEASPDGPPAVILSDAYWRRQFAADPGVVGTTLALDQQTLTIVGVAAPAFRFPARADVYAADQGRLATTSRTAHNYRAVGRLAEGATLTAAQAEMTGIAARLTAAYPRSNGDKGVRLTPIHDAVVGATRQTLFVLLGAVGFVLLIACANVANLLLARASARGREIVVRAAVGAGRGRLVRQLLTESAVLAIIAGIGGAVIARWGVAALLALAPADLPRLDEVTVDVAALGFALALSLMASLIFGLAPAWHVSRIDLADGLRQGGKGSALGVRGGWARKVFVVAEIGLAVALVMGAGLLGRSLIALARVDMGFDSERLAVLRTTVPVAGPDEFSRATAVYRELLGEVRGLPGVAAAGAVSGLPSAPTSNGGYWIEDGPGPEELGMASPQALFTVITPGYFDALRVPVVRGRDLGDGDRRDAPFVAVVNEQLVKDAFPGVDPIGRTIRAGLDSLTPMTIVGIVKDIRTRGPARPVQAEIYFPYEQHPGPATALNLVVRADGSAPLAAGAAAAKLVRSRHAEMPVRLESMTTTLAASTATPRFRTALLVVFAGVALLLAIAGVYGVMAYTVSQRVPEFGLRVALGATPHDVLGLVLKDGGVLVAAGLALGTALTMGGSQLLSGLLFSVSARDPLVLAGVAALVAVAGLAACLVPGRRAVRADPLLALRGE
jgi:putative ABC transport system permease protein